MLKRASFLSALAGLALSLPAHAASSSLLNVSYDPTRELYQDINTQFAADWKKKTGEDISIQTSHGGSSKQARSVIDGLEADVVTLGLPYDIDQIAKIAKVVSPDWRSQFPNNGLPYTSTLVFVVRKGNPKAIKGWDDLVKPGVAVVVPNPKTSGGGRWAYVAAWGYGVKKLGSEDKAKDYIQKLYKNVPVLDTGARGSTTTLAQREVGDVLVTWENEAFLTLNEFGADKFEIVTPSVSVLAEPPVALVEANAAKHGTLKQAKAYLDFLYSPAGQKTEAAHYYRPLKPEFADKADLARFPKLELLKFSDLFKSWDELNTTHLADGALFDQLYQSKS